MVKIQPFSPIFPLADSMAEIFFGYLFEISRNTYQSSAMAQPSEKPKPGQVPFLSTPSFRRRTPPSKKPSFLHGMGKRPHRSSQSPFRLFPAMPGDGRREKAAVLPNSPSPLTKVLGRRREGVRGREEEPFLQKGFLLPPPGRRVSPLAKSTSGPRRNRRTRGGR